MTDQICEVCKQEPMVGVACVPGIPYSAAYGQKCLEMGADPWGIVRINIKCCDGPENVVPEYLEGMTFFEGGYMSIKEALEKNPITPLELQEMWDGYEKASCTCNGDHECEGHRA